MDGEIGVYIAIAIAGYLLGSFPTGYVVVKRFAGKNLLEYGTANVGTMNTLRATSSKKLTILVLVGDMLKGVAALAFGLLLAKTLDADAPTASAVGGALVVVGHNYSVFLRFKGGKGLATATPVLLWFAPPLLAVWVGAFLLTVAASRLMVLGQIVATVVAPIVGHFTFPDEAPFLDLLAALVFIRHAPRLKNVFQGTEPKLYYKIRSPEGR